MMVRTGSPANASLVFPQARKSSVFKLPLDGGAMRSAVSGLRLRIGIAGERGLRIQWIVFARSASRTCIRTRGGNSFFRFASFRFASPTSATMILRIPACPRTSTCGRRSGDRTNRIARSMVARWSTASPAPASPRKKTRLLVRKRCQPPARIGRNLFTEAPYAKQMGTKKSRNFMSLDVQNGSKLGRLSTGLFTSLLTAVQRNTGRNFWPMEPRARSPE